MYAAEGYEKWSPTPASRDADLYEKLFEKMNIDKSKKQFKILDFGSGTGAPASHFLVPLAQETDSQITCIDVSEEMIEFSKHNYPHERVKYLACDLLDENFPFEEYTGYFDYIFSFYVLHFINDYREIFKRLSRLLKPGGQFGFVTIVKHNEFKVDKMIGQDPKWSQYTHDFEKYLPDWIISGEDPLTYMRAAIDASGFKIIQMDLLNRVTPYQSMNAYAGFHHSILPFNGVIPKSMHEDVKKSIRSYLCELKGLPDSEDTYLKPTNGEYQVILALIQK